MAIKPEQLKFLRKEPLKDPKAEDILREFEKCVDYCNETKTTLTKGFWHIFLNITDQTYVNWQNTGMNTNLNDEEFTERLGVLKKVSTFLENGMADEMLTTRYPTALIFYMKNAFKWADKHEPENTFNFKFDGFAPSKTTKKDDKKDVTVTSSGTNAP